MAERTAMLIDGDGNPVGVDGNPLYIGGIVSVGSLEELTDVTIVSPASGDYIGYDAATGKYVNKPVTGTGMGDVTGPSGAVSGNLPVLDSSGKILSDSGVNVASFGDVDGPVGAVAGNIPLLDSTGKILSDSGINADSVGDVTGPASSGVRSLAGFADVAGKTIISLPVTVTVDGDIDMSGQAVINLAFPTVSGDSATKGYVDQFLQGMSWQDPVISIVTASPSTPTDGDRYIVGVPGTGDFVGQDNKIATWVSATADWSYVVPASGCAVYNADTATIWVFNGTTWINIGTSGVPEAPSDNLYYTRRNGVWVEGASNEHGSHHTSTGDDAIPAVVAAGASGLMTGADKTKLDGIAVGAEVNVNADWNSSSGDSQILNKPSIPEAYSLPIATGSVLGGVKIGANVSVASDGTISVASGGSAASVFEYIKWTLEGVVYETTMLYWVAEQACTINSAALHASSNSSATGTYLKVQIMKNGVLETNSVFASDAPIQITENTTPTNGIYTGTGTLDSGQVSLAAGDVLWARVNQADTGNADMRIAVKVTYT